MVYDSFSDFLFFLVLEKLGTDDDELPNIADLIVKKCVRKQSQISRLVNECEKIIERKPLFRNILLQYLEKTQENRKSMKKENRDHFMGLTALLIEGNICTFSRFFGSFIFTKVQRVSKSWSNF